MAVMMIVRTAPDAARTEDEDAEDGHEPVGEPGVWENRAVLLVVVNDEQAQEEKAGEQAANDSSGKI